MYRFTASAELCSPCSQSLTVVTGKQCMHFAERSMDRGQIWAWPREGKRHPQFPFHSQYSDQYCVRMLNICHQTITHWWNKSMDDRREWDKAVCLLTKLLRDGEGEEKERWRRQRFVALRRWDFSLGYYLYFFFPFFCCGWGTTMSKWMRGLVSRGVCERVWRHPPVKMLYIVRELLSNWTRAHTSSVVRLSDYPQFLL